MWFPLMENRPLLADSEALRSSSRERAARRVGACIGGFRRYFCRAWAIGSGVRISRFRCDPTEAQSRRHRPDFMAERPDGDRCKRIEDCDRRYRGGAISTVLDTSPTVDPGAYRLEIPLGHRPDRWCAVLADFCERFTAIGLKVEDGGSLSPMKAQSDSFAACGGVSKAEMRCGLHRDDTQGRRGGKRRYCLRWKIYRGNGARLSHRRGLIAEKRVDARAAKKPKRDEIEAQPWPRAAGAARMPIVPKPKVSNKPLQMNTKQHRLAAKKRAGGDIDS